MVITQEKIKALYVLYEELEVAERNANEALSHAKSFGDKQITVKRKDGKHQTLSEKLLWDEVYYMGKESEGYEVLHKKYPEVFEKSALMMKKQKELKQFSVRELGIDANQIKLSDIIRLVEAVVDYKSKPLWKRLLRM